MKFINEKIEFIKMDFENDLLSGNLNDDDDIIVVKDPSSIKLEDQDLEKTNYCPLAIKTNKNVDSILEVPDDHALLNIDRVEFNSDKSKMFVISFNTKNIHEVTLTTPGDMSTIDLDSTVSQLLPNDDLDIRDAQIVDNGNKLIVLCTNNTFYQYTFGTAYDMSTITDYGIIMASPVSDTYSFRVVLNGAKIITQTRDYLRELTFLDAYDITTLAYNDKYYYNGQRYESRLTISPDGKYVYNNATNGMCYINTLEFPFNLEVVEEMRQTGDHYNWYYFDMNSNNDTVSTRSVQFSSDFSNVMFVSNNRIKFTQFDSEYMFETIKIDSKISDNRTDNHSTFTSSHAFSKDGMNAFIISDRKKLIRYKLSEAWNLESVYADFKYDIREIIHSMGNHWENNDDINVWMQSLFFGDDDDIYYNNINHTGEGNLLERYKLSFNENDLISKEISRVDNTNANWTNGGQVFRVNGEKIIMVYHYNYIYFLVEAEDGTVSQKLDDNNNPVNLKYTSHSDYNSYQDVNGYQMFFDNKFNFYHYSRHSDTLYKREYLLEDNGAHFGECGNTEVYSSNIEVAYLRTDDRIWDMKFENNGNIFSYIETYNNDEIKAIKLEKPYKISNIKSSAFTLVGYDSEFTDIVFNTDGSEAITFNWRDYNITKFILAENYLLDSVIASHIIELSSDPLDVNKKGVMAKLTLDNVNNRLIIFGNGLYTITFKSGDNLNTFTDEMLEMDSYHTYTSTPFSWSWNHDSNGYDGVISPDGKYYYNIHSGDYASRSIMENPFDVENMTNEYNGRTYNYFAEGSFNTTKNKSQFMFSHDMNHFFHYRDTQKEMFRYDLKEGGTPGLLDDYTRNYDNVFKDIRWNRGETNVWFIDNGNKLLNKTVVNGSSKFYIYDLERPYDTTAVNFDMAEDYNLSKTNFEFREKYLQVQPDTNNGIIDENTGYELILLSGTQSKIVQYKNKTIGNYNYDNIEYVENILDVDNFIDIINDNGGLSIDESDPQLLEKSTRYYATYKLDGSELYIINIDQKQLLQMPLSTNFNMYSYDISTITLINIDYLSDTDLNVNSIYDTYTLNLEDLIETTGANVVSRDGHVDDSDNLLAALVQENDEERYNYNSRILRTTEETGTVTDVVDFGEGNEFQLDSLTLANFGLLDTVKNANGEIVTIESSKTTLANTHPDYDPNSRGASEVSRTNGHFLADDILTLTQLVSNKSTVERDGVLNIVSNGGKRTLTEIVDAGEEYTYTINTITSIGGVTDPDGTQRHSDAFHIYKSDDGSNWDLHYSSNKDDNKTHNINLTSRFIKLEVPYVEGDSDPDGLVRIYMADFDTEHTIGDFISCSHNVDDSIDYDPIRDGASLISTSNVATGSGTSTLFHLLTSAISVNFNEVTSIQTTGSEADYEEIIDAGEGKEFNITTFKTRSTDTINSHGFYLYTSDDNISWFLQYQGEPTDNNEITHNINLISRFIKLVIPYDENIAPADGTARLVIDNIGDGTIYTNDIMDYLHRDIKFIKTFIPKFKLSISDDGETWETAYHQTELEKFSPDFGMGFTGNVLPYRNNNDKYTNGVRAAFIALINGVTSRYQVEGFGSNYRKYMCNDYDNYGFNNPNKAWNFRVQSSSYIRVALKETNGCCYVTRTHSWFSGSYGERMYKMLGDSYNMCYLKNAKEIIVDKKARFWKIELEHSDTNAQYNLLPIFNSKGHIESNKSKGIPFDNIKSIKFIDNNLYVSGDTIPGFKVNQFKLDNDLNKIDEFSYSQFNNTVFDFDHSGDNLLISNKSNKSDNSKKYNINLIENGEKFNLSNYNCNFDYANDLTDYNPKHLLGCSFGDNGIINETSFEDKQETNQIENKSFLKLRNDSTREIIDLSKYGITYDYSNVLFQSFNNDGTQYVVMNKLSMFEFSCSTPYDLRTLEFQRIETRTLYEGFSNSNAYNTYDYFLNSLKVTFDNDGNQIWTSCYDEYYVKFRKVIGNDLMDFNDPAKRVLVKTLNLNDWYTTDDGRTYPRSAWFSDDGHYIFIGWHYTSGTNHDVLYRFDLGTNYDPTTITSDDNLSWDLRSYSPFNRSVQPEVLISDGGRDNIQFCSDSKTLFLSYRNNANDHITDYVDRDVTEKIEPIFYNENNDYNHYIASTRPIRIKKDDRNELVLLTKDGNLILQSLDQLELNKQNTTLPYSNEENTSDINNVYLYQSVEFIDTNTFLRGNDNVISICERNADNSIKITKPSIGFPSSHLNNSNVSKRRVTGLKFLDNGNKLFIGFGSNDMYIYNLDNSFDTTTIDMDNPDYSIVNDSTDYYINVISEDGTELNVLDYNNNMFRAYSLSTPFDFDTSTLIYEVNPADLANTKDGRVDNYLVLNDGILFIDQMSIFKLKYLDVNDKSKGFDDGAVTYNNHANILNNSAFTQMLEWNKDKSEILTYSGGVLTILDLDEINKPVSIINHKNINLDINNTIANLEYNNDGTKILMSKYDSNILYSIDLTEGYNIKTMLFDNSMQLKELEEIQKDNIITDMKWNSDGSILFIITNSGDIYKYSTTSYNINALVYDSMIQTSLTFTTAILKPNYIFTYDGSNVKKYSTNEEYGYSQLTEESTILQYSSIRSFDVTPTDDIIYSRTNSNDNLFYYDQGEKTHTRKGTMPVLPISGSGLYCVKYSNNGLQIDLGNQFNNIGSINLDKAYSFTILVDDIETLSLEGEIYNLLGITFNEDGTEVWLCGDKDSSGVKSRWAKFILTEPYNLKTRVYTYHKVEMNTENTNDYETFKFCDNGKKICTLKNRRVIEFHELNTPWQPHEGMTKLNETNISEASTILNLNINNDGSKIWFASADTNHVHQLDLDTNFDATSYTFKTLATNEYGITTRYAMDLSNDGTKILQMDDSKNLLITHLEDPFDITSNTEQVSTYIRLDVYPNTSEMYCMSLIESRHEIVVGCQTGFFIINYKDANKIDGNYQYFAGSTTLAKVKYIDDKDFQVISNDTELQMDINEIDKLYLCDKNTLEKQIAPNYANNFCMVQPDQKFLTPKLDFTTFDNINLSITNFDYECNVKVNFLQDNDGELVSVNTGTIIAGQGDLKVVVDDSNNIININNTDILVVVPNIETSLDYIKLEGLDEAETLDDITRVNEKELFEVIDDMKFEYDEDGMIYSIVSPGAIASEILCFKLILNNNGTTNSNLTRVQINNRVIAQEAKTLDLNSLSLDNTFTETEQNI